MSDRSPDHNLGAVPRKFYGSGIVRQIFERIEAPGNVNVVGLAGSGKTTLIGYICQPAVQRYYLRESEQYRFIPLSFAHVYSPEDFVRLTLKQISEVYGVKSLATMPQERAMTALQERLEDLYRHVVVLVVNDFEAILQPERIKGFDYTFFEGLRGLRSDGQRACIWVVMTRKRLGPLFRDSVPWTTSPFYNTFADLYLGRPDAAACKELLGVIQSQKPLLTEEDAVWLRELCGDTPASILFGAERLVHARVDYPDRSPYERVRSDVLDWLYGQVAEYEQHLEAAEFRILEDLASGVQFVPSPDTLRATHSLENYGLIYEQGETFALTSQALRDAIRRHRARRPTIVPLEPDAGVLREALLRLFSRADLVILCSDLQTEIQKRDPRVHLSFDMLPGDDVEVKLDALITRMRQRNMLSLLVQRVREERPDSALGF